MSDPALSLSCETPSKADEVSLINQLVFDGPDPSYPLEFRPIHYMGGKWRLLDAVEAAVARCNSYDGRVCDLFSGSGVVAARLANRYPTLAADIQEYSRVLSAALLGARPVSENLANDLLERAHECELTLRTDSLQRLIDFERRAMRDAVAGYPEGLGILLEHGSIAGSALDGAPAPDSISELVTSARDIPIGPNSALSCYYGGVYFSYEQALALDALARAARELPTEFRDSSVAAVLSTASEVVTTVGNQFAQPIRPRGADGKFKQRALVALANARARSVFDTFDKWLQRYRARPEPRHEANAIRADFRDTLSSMPQDVAVVYADPPYTRDHYSRFYHVLETIALGDDPGISRTNLAVRANAPSRGLYRSDRHQSPFCIKSQVSPAFAGLFSGAAKVGAAVVLSYSPNSPATKARPQTRLMTIDEICSIAREHYRNVIVESAGRLTHSKFNAERLNAEISPEAEVLVICTQP